MGLIAQFCSKSRMPRMAIGGRRHILAALLRDVFLLLQLASAASEYKLFLRQTGPTVLPAEKWNNMVDGGESSPNYSILDQLETCRSGGVFIFKTLWPKGDIAKPEPSHNIWRQSSNPLTVGPTQGYVPIDVQRPEHDFRGLTFGMSKDNKLTLLCNQCDSGNWWHALGALAGPWCVPCLIRLGGETFIHGPSLIDGGCLAYATAATSSQGRPAQRWRSCGWTAGLNGAGRSSVCWARVRRSTSVCRFRWRVGRAAVARS